MLDAIPVKYKADLLTIWWSHCFHMPGIYVGTTHTKNEEKIDCYVVYPLFDLFQVILFISLSIM